MNNDVQIEQLLRWRLARAEAAAPPAPRAARLLALARPWWETAPEQFRDLVDRLLKIQLVYGHAMEEPNSGRSGQLVPALIVEAGGEKESFARLLYFSVHEGRLRARFQLEQEAGAAQPAFEVTFVRTADRVPLFSALAAWSVDSEYRLDTELPVNLAGDWPRLKVTDGMPFRLILRPIATGV